MTSLFLQQAKEDYCNRIASVMAKMRRPSFNGSAFRLRIIIPLLGIVFLGLFHEQWISFFAFLERPLVQASLFLGPHASQENDLLKAIGAGEMVERERLQAENEELKKQIGFFDTHPYQHIPATVLTRSITPLSETILIDQGSDKGIGEGDAVVVGEGVVIGKIISVSSHSAIARLLTDRQSKLAVMLLGQTDTSGLIEGTSGAFLTMNFIPRQEDIHTGALIVTSGLEQGIPSGLLVGTVRDIGDEPTAAFRRVTVQPFVDSHFLHLVNIIHLSTTYGSSSSGG